MKAVIMLLALLPNLPAQAKFSITVFEAATRIADARYRFLAKLAPFDDNQSGDASGLQESYAKYVKAVADGLAAAHSPVDPALSECLELKRAFLILLAVDRDEIGDLAWIVARIGSSNGPLAPLDRLNASGSLNRSESAQATASKRFLAAARDCDRFFHFFRTVTF